MIDVACPVCATEFDLATLLATEEERRALVRLVAISSPLRARLSQYLQLHKPPKQRLTGPKAVRLMEQLLPDLERGSIAWKGRDWPAPLRAWQVAIDQLLSKRNAATLELPLTGHGTPKAFDSWARRYAKRFPDGPRLLRRQCRVRLDTVTRALEFEANARTIRVDRASSRVRCGLLQQK